VTTVAGIVALAGAGLVRLSVLRNTAELRAAAQRLTIESADALSQQSDEMSATVRKMILQVAAPDDVQDLEQMAASITSRSRQGLVLLQVSNGRLVAGVPAGSESAQFAGLPFEEWSTGADPGQVGYAAQPVGDGPIRMAGGHWAIVVRMPVRGTTLRSEDWLAAARSIDSLAQLAGLNRLPSQGFDFHLSYRDPETRQVHQFLASTDLMLEKPVERNIPVLQTTWILSTSLRVGSNLRSPGGNPHSRPSTRARTPAPGVG
jgi:hypothetical protein